MATIETDPFIAKIFDVFEHRGDEKYADEEVTQVEHAIQCGQLAREACSDAQIVVAALLHDVGHLLSDSDLPQSCNDDLNDFHEQSGYEFLLGGFGERVAEIVRLHVAAKRYLCSHDGDYQSQLSPTSLKSLQDQGGAMSNSESEEFEANPYFKEAIQLRRWDDQAKLKDIPMVGVRDFLPELNVSLVKAK